MNAYLLYAAIMLFVDGINMPGFDYSNFNATSPAICRDSCGGDPKCQGWTWVKPGFQGPSGHCWLKFTLPNLVKDACCNSGPRSFIEPKDLRAEDRTNRPGSDFSNFDLDAWQACESTCARDGRCAAWSFVRPGVQGKRGHCWLKNRVPNPAPDARVISGVKWRASGKIDEDP